MKQLRDLHLRWNGRVLALALRILRDREEAQEAAQEVFIEVWRRLPEYDEARGTEWAWLRMMTQSRCFDRLRAARRHARLEEEARVDTLPEEPPPNDGDRGDVTALLARLPSAQRELIEMAFIEGCTHREISSRTGQPLGTVKTRIRLGLQRLAAILLVHLDPVPLSVGGRRAS